MPELYFKGKEFVYTHHLTVPYRPLETQPDKSIGEDSATKTCTPSRRCCNAQL